MIVSDTTKVIIDTVRTSSKDSMELLNKMDIFYNNAWTKLVIFVTISFAIMGVFIPALIQWYQKRELKLSEDKLRNDIKDEISKAVTEIQKNVDEKSEKQLKQLRLEIKGLGHHLQAVVYTKNKSYPEAVGEFLKAIKFHLEGKDFSNAKQAFSGVKESIPYCSKKELDLILLRWKTSFTKVIAILNDRNYDNLATESIKMIEDLYNNLPVQPKQGN